MTGTLFPTNGAADQAHVLFFAAIPAAGPAADFAAAWRDHGSGERFRADRLHMTLYYATSTVCAGDDPPAPLVAALIAAGAAVRAAPFTLVFDRIRPLGKPQNPALAFAADDAEGRAQDLFEQLRRACVLNGIRPPKGTPDRAAPHVTAAYGRGPGLSRDLPRPIRWTIDHIALFDSLQGQGRHVELARWPLGVPDPLDLAPGLGHTGSSL